jgi:predicted Rossmann fold flavoprotein
MAEKEYTVQVVINWCREEHEQSMRERLQRYRILHGKQRVLQKSPIPVPIRLWEYLARSSGVVAQHWADLPASVQNKLAKQVTAFELGIKGKTTFKEEFVTAGGVQLSEVDPANMQSRKVPGLYFAGEVLDVDGITGGYNFQHAWTSGYNAARHIAGKSLH